MTVSETQRLQKRILLLSLLALLLVGLIAAGATAVTYYQQALNRAELAQQANLRHHALTLSQFLTRIEDIASQIASRSQVRDELAAFNRGERTLEALQAFSIDKLWDALEPSDAVAMVRFDQALQPVIRVGEIPLAVEQLPVPEPDAAASHIMGFLFAEATPYLLASAPIRDRGNVWLGADLLLFPVEPLARLLGPAARSGEAFLLHDGSVIAWKNAKWWVTDSMDAIEDGYAATLTGAEGRLSTTRDGVRHQLFYGPVATDWGLVVTVPTGTLYAGTLAHLWLPAGAVLAMALLGGIGTVRLLRPLSRQVVEQAAALQQARDEQEELLEYARGFVFRCDLLGRITYLSPGVKKVLGFAPSAVPTAAQAQLVEPFLAVVHATAVRPVGSAGTDLPPARVTIEHRAGQRMVLELNARVQSLDGLPRDIFGVARDVTESACIEEELRLAARVFRDSAEAIVISDADDRIMRVNEAFSRLVGYQAQEVLGGTLGHLLCAVPDHPIREEVRRQLLAEGSWQGELILRRNDHERFPAWYRVSSVDDDTGATSNYIHVFSDISERKRSEARIHHMAHYDLLTDLPNRELLNDRLRQAVQRSERRGTRLAVLFVDLDGFKHVNDSLGHHAGDELLRAVADRFRHSIRKQDTVARLGGDEFIVLAEELEHREHAGQVAAKLLEALGPPFAIFGHELFIGASIGISLYPDDASEPGALIRDADSAMYQAKSKGRNNMQFYTAELTLGSRRRLSLEAGLRRAIEQDELEVHYQPQWRLSDYQLVGAEALVRWRHPDYGLVSPAEFIPFAEENGTIGMLGEWVLRRAVEQTLAWGDGRLPRISVNLSGHQILYADIVKQVKTLLAESGLAAERLELEITEGFVIDHAERGIAVLEALCALGTKLAIDDFGTGYSSLSYLKRLPVHRLKIDGSFIRGAASDPADAALTTSIIGMAHKLGLDVVAEGVETGAQLEMLRAEGCDEVQGYYLSPPLSGDEFTELLQSGHQRGLGLG